MIIWHMLVRLSAKRHTSGWTNSAGVYRPSNARYLGIDIDDSLILSEQAALNAASRQALVAVVAETALPAAVRTPITSQTMPLTLSTYE